MSSVIKERPIVFGPIVRAILDGSKTQTRRIVKPVRGFEWNNVCRPDLIGDPWVVWWHGKSENVGCLQVCPHGIPGEQLWVREQFCVFPSDAPDGMGHNVYYRADDCNLSDVALEVMQRNNVRWRSSISMPRSASRVLLEITDVRVERLQEISDEDAWAEGCEPYDCNPLEWFRAMWEFDNGPGSWDANPWVWVILFRRIQP